MKKLLMLMTLIVSINCFGHHLDAKGWCDFQGGKAFFQTVSFSNNLEVQVRFYNTSTVVVTFNTPATGSTATVFSVAQPTQNGTVKIQFRYRHVGSSGNSGWSNWGDGENDSNTYEVSSTSPYSGCGSLPIHFEYIKTRKLDAHTIEVEFKANETENQVRFNVQLSLDGKNYKTVGIIFPDPIILNKVYKIKIKL